MPSLRLTLTAAIALAATAAAAPRARAEPRNADVDADMDADAEADAGPVPGRILTAPTAWLPRGGSVAAVVGVDHRGDGEATAILGLGDLAALDVGVDTDVRGAGEGGAPRPLWLGRAGFRMGAREGAWFAGMPALALGVRATFAARGHALHAPRASEAYAVASRAVGALRLHAGVAAIAGELDGVRGPARVRPFGGIEVHPPQYPRSSLLADLAWQPALIGGRAPEPAWLLGVGVRYRAFDWASIELAVRVREGEELGASTVLMRVHVAGRAAPRRAIPRRGT